MTSGTTTRDSSRGLICRRKTRSGTPNSYGYFAADLAGAVSQSDFRAVYR